MEREDYEAKMDPGAPAGGELRASFYGKLRQVCKITDDAEGNVNPRVCLYVEVDPAMALIGVPLSKELTDKLVASLISARNMIWPGP